MKRVIRVRQGRRSLRGHCRVPGDKSISHRGLLLGAIGQGPSHVHGFLRGRDCEATLQVVRDLGICVEEVGQTELIVHGKGLHGLEEPKNVLDCANSGTTMRLMAGLLAGQPFSSILTGTEQLRGRPMARITGPLRQLGANIIGRQEGGLAPLAIRGGGLSAIRYEMPMASAQVKSAVILAALYAQGTTSVVEPGPTRDHTENMLVSMGVELKRQGKEIQIRPPAGPLEPMNMQVPGDPSSAAFLLVAASLCPSSDVLLESVGTNPTRTGMLETLREMGAGITDERPTFCAAEPVANHRVRSAQLSPTQIDGDRIVTMIDEVPVFAVAATQAQGTTVLADAAELRVKETDRIATTLKELKKLGAKAEATQDGMVIHGPTRLTGTDVDSHGDHRLAMALTVAGLAAEGETRIHGAEVTADSFPGFEDTLISLGADLTMQ